MNYFDQTIKFAEDNALMLISNKPRDKLSEQILFKRNVEIINLELSYQCNRICDYCPVSSSTRSLQQEFMSNELILKICDELIEIRYENRISLNLYNEPLLDSNLHEKISLIRGKLKFCNIGFNTNGDKLNYKLFQNFANAGCDHICVTLHPPPFKINSKDLIIKRVKKLLEKLYYHDSIKEINIDEGSIEFRHLGVTLKIQWPNWRSQGTNRAGTLKNHLSNSSNRVSPCNKPFREFTIFYDGTVQPCCESFHDTQISLVNIGNSNNQSIFTLYSSEVLSKFRYHLFDFGPKNGICSNCSSVDFSHPDDDQIRKTIKHKVMAW